MGIAIYLATTTILLQRSHSTELEVTTNTYLTKIRSREGLQTINEYDERPYMHARRS